MGDAHIHLCPECKDFYRCECTAEVSRHTWDGIAIVDALCDDCTPIEAEVYMPLPHDREIARLRTENATLLTRTEAAERVVQAAQSAVAAADACDHEAERHPSSRSSAPVVRAINAMNALRDALREHAKGAKP